MSNAHQSCPTLANKYRRTHSGHGGLVRYTEPCGLPLTEQGLCPLHNGPMCDVCSMPLQTVQEQRWGRHGGCVTVRPEPVPRTAEQDEAGLAWLERERARLGGRQGMADEKVMASKYGKSSEELRREMRR